MKKRGCERANDRYQPPEQLCSTARGCALCLSGDARAALRCHVHALKLAKAERDLHMSMYYEAAREISKQLTAWSKSPDDTPMGLKFSVQ